MSIRTRNELKVQIDAGIKVNGNREITPPIHNSIETNIIDSYLNFKDGGNLVQQPAGYTSELTLTDRKNFAYKGYVDDAIASVVIDDSPFLFHDGSRPMTGDLEFDGNGILGLGYIFDEVGQLAIDVLGRTLRAGNGSVIGDFGNFSTGFGVRAGGSLTAYLRTSLLSGVQTFEFPNESGTLLVSNNTHKLTNQELSTGLYSWVGGIVATGATTFDVGTAQGYIVNSTDPLNIETIFVNYLGGTGLTTPFIGSSPATYLLIDNTSALVMQGTEPTLAQRRNNIFLGVIGHPTGTITGTGNFPDLSLNTFSQTREMFKPIRFINEGVFLFANSTNLSLANTSGTLHGLGVGFIANGPDSPTTLNISPGSPTTFQYRTRTGAVEGNTTVVEPLFSDVAGVKTAIPGSGNQATNQRAYLLANGTIRFQYGQIIYPTLIDAIAAASNESFITFVNAKLLGILIGIVSVTKGCTNLADTATARFLPVSKFGETVGAAAGIAIGTLQTAFNNSAVPQIQPTDALGALFIRSARASNNDYILVGQSNVATDIFGLKGNGDIDFGGQFFRFFNGSGNTILGTVTNGLPLRILGNGGTGSGDVLVLGANNNLVPISGTQSLIKLSANYNVGAGSATFNVLDYSGVTYNQFINNQPIRGIYYAPTVSNIVGPHFFIETLSGDVKFGGTTQKTYVNELHVLDFDNVNYKQALASNNVSNSLNVGMDFQSTVIRATNVTQHIISVFQTVASAVNYLQVTSGATGSGPIIQPNGSDTNVGLRFQTKGTATNNGFQFTANTDGSLISSTALFLNTPSATGDSTITHYNSGAGNLNQRSVFRFIQNNSSAAASVVSHIWAKPLDITPASEDSQIGLDVTINAVRTNLMTLDGTNGLIVNQKARFGSSTAPVSFVDIAAGTALVAPLKFTSGPILSTPVIGTHEFLVDDYYLTGTTGTTRKVIRDYAYTAATANITLDGSHEFLDCTTGTFNVTLPTAVNYKKQYTIYNSGAGVITMLTTGGQTISGAASGTLTLIQNDTIILRSNGANWYKIN